MTIFSSLHIVSCTTCNINLQAQIFGDSFFLYTAYMLLPFGVAGVLLVGLHRLLD